MTDDARDVRVELSVDGPERTAVTLVHSGFERHGAGWEAMRDSVGSEDGWPNLANTYAKAAAATATRSA